MYKGQPNKSDFFVREIMQRNAPDVNTIIDIHAGEIGEGEEEEGGVRGGGMSP